MQSENIQSAFYMMLGMMGFAVNDAFMKLVLADLNLYQSIFVRGIFATAFLGILAVRSDALKNSRQHFNRHIIVRTLCELGGTIFFLTALVHVSLADASAVLQVMPLAVTLAAALFMREAVGWRRYLAILIGFFGVMLVIQPDGSSAEGGGFNIYFLMLFGTIACMVVRDLTTRRISPNIPSMFIAFYTSLAVMLMGAILSVFEPWKVITLVHMAMLAGAAVFIFLGYIGTVMAMRLGDVGFVAPFRYTYLVWAMALSIFVFADYPDAYTLIGSGIVVTMGIYSFLRERKLMKTKAA
ncbi:DMT family transporter [Kordiimonas sp. SCSIO 12610]|uniref:DMT family transporter n=1 Tax=Kordiimonas sp. SCSIO 12610 TaxID=2829597 RepID=UPI00210CDD70|nr:DMT family transporter [Kordiimonas sp. SCSIO 12610]UTW56432.1 DMT family transporter [Kordiimonas sp. SCSIO 12610]